MTTKLLFATNNQGKLKELKQLLSAAELTAFELISAADLETPLAEVEEDGETFAENAVKKARAAMEATGYTALADDSGLEVDALGGAPGVRSARYAGPNKSDADRNHKLLSELEGRADRQARFRCAIALVHVGRPGEPIVCQGQCQGRILDAVQGEGGFGYDPLFFVESLGKTFAEAEAAEKNAISHRGRAMAELVRYLASKA